MYESLSKQVHDNVKISKFNPLGKLGRTCKVYGIGEGESVIILRKRRERKERRDISNPPTINTKVYKPPGVPKSKFISLIVLVEFHVLILFGCTEMEMMMSARKGRSCHHAKIHACDRYFSLLTLVLTFHILNNWRY